MGGAAEGSSSDSEVPASASVQMASNPTKPPTESMAKSKSAFLQAPLSGKLQQMQRPTAAPDENSSPDDGQSPEEEAGAAHSEKVHTRCRLMHCCPVSAVRCDSICSRLIGVPLAIGLTGTCLGLALICMGVVCFSR
jgi:hypothetical protein